MNEIQIIQKQLATEHSHFAEVAAACEKSLPVAARTGQLRAAGEFGAACADYFEFAVSRFEPAIAQQLKDQLVAGPASQFLADFTVQSAKHFQRLGALLGASTPVTQWRAVSRIDADSIYAERARYMRVQAATPA